MSRPRKSNKHLPKYVTVIHGSFWYGPPGQKRHRVCPVDDEPTLYRFMADKLTPQGPVYLVRDMLNRYSTEVLPTLEPRTQKDYRRHLKVLDAVFGDMRPDDVLPKHVGQFLDVSKGKIQRNRIVAVLSAVYTKAVGRWYCADRNPCKGVERNESRKRDRYVTDAEYAAVYALHGPRMQVAMDLALLTGQRQGDLLRLHWSKVTPEGVEFRQGKTGKRLMVGMSPTLEAVLNRARGFLPHLPREYVLRRRDGKPYSENGFRAIWQRVMRQYVKGGGIRFTFHDLRAKSVSDSGSLQDAMERAGHTSMAMTRGVYDRGVRKVTPLR
jgi:integrase